MTTKATLKDLYRILGKAELVGGKLVLMAPTGDLPSRAGGASLRQYERQMGNGRAYPDNTGFKVNLPHRQTFSPDAAFYTGKPTGMRFLEGAPIFAAEIRSEDEKAAEEALAKKRADYFAAGTLVAWDVDLLGEDVVRVYRASDPNSPNVYQRGDVAEAEPAVPGRRMPVDELFE